MFLVKVLSRILFRRLYFKVAHPKVQYSPVFLYFYTISMILFSRLYFKMAQPKMQYNLAFFFVFLHSFDECISSLGYANSSSKDKRKSLHTIYCVYICICVCVCAYIYLDETFQSAYKAFHSTETALIRVHNDILTAIDNNNTVILLLLPPICCL